ncbi:mobile element protein [Rhodococcus wratislaviensis]|uniref:Mobile element protein n=1 Tax=Rhodococcus wratislaviensis TaxID=44752 RepID=A0A402CH79_RHOWR|nr:mobile element protein [Rhodococcus wratislaviensis]
MVLRWHVDDVRGRFPDSSALLCDESGFGTVAATIRNRLRHSMGVEGRPESSGSARTNASRLRYANSRARR